jgi:hypothetical protein
MRRVCCRFPADRGQARSYRNCRILMSLFLFLLLILLFDINGSNAAKRDLGAG